METILDRINEDYEGMHPVEFAVPLIQDGKKILKKAYNFDSPTGGHSARDIIRHDLGTYPYETFEPKYNLKDPSMGAPYLLEENGGLIPMGPAVKTAADAKKVLKVYNDAYNDPNHFKLVNNVKSKGKSKEQKKFDKAYSDWTSIKDSYKRIDPLTIEHEDLEGLRKAIERRNAELPNGIERTTGVGPLAQLNPNYGLVNWQDYVDAKNRAQEAGHELAKQFSRKNAMEKKNYARLAGDGYTLGGENHTFTNDNRHMEDYEDMDFLKHNSRYIQRDENGNPVIKLFHWTDKGNVPSIMRTGLLDQIGPDSREYNAMSGGWFSGNDKNFMNLNFFNNGRPGEGNFNEELIEANVPLKEYNRRLVTHDPMSQSKVDVFRANPGDRGMILERDGKRKYYRYPVPADYMTVHPEDSDYFLTYDYPYSPRGWHPNKEKRSMNELYQRMFKVPKELLSDSEREMYDRYVHSAFVHDDMNNTAAEILKNKAAIAAMKKNYVKEAYGNWGFKPSSINDVINGTSKDPDLLQEQTRIQHYLGMDVKTPYDMAAPIPRIKLSEGAVVRGGERKGAVTYADNVDELYSRDYNPIATAKNTRSKIADFYGDNVDVKDFVPADEDEYRFYPNNHYAPSPKNNGGEAFKRYITNFLGNPDGLGITNAMMENQYLKNAGVIPKNFDTSLYSRKVSDVAKKGEHSMYNANMLVKKSLYHNALVDMENKKFQDTMRAQLQKTMDELYEKVSEFGYKHGVDYNDPNMTISELESKGVEIPKEIRQLQGKLRNIRESLSKDKMLLVGKRLPLNSAEKKKVYDKVFDLSNQRNISANDEYPLYNFKNEILENPDGRRYSFKKMLQSDSLDRVLGHQLGKMEKKIQDYRARRGK